MISVGDLVSPYRSRPGQDTPMTSSHVALVIAHPGHELRVHGWLEQVRPRVFILTDGSGSSGQPRLRSTRRILKQAGAVRGEVFGRFTDRDLYEALRHGDREPFTAVVTELSTA